MEHNCTFDDGDDTLEIHWTGDTRFVGDQEGFDLTRSWDAFVVELAEAIVREYPEATVSVSLIEAWGSEPEITVTPLPEPEREDDRMAGYLGQAQEFTSQVAIKVFNGRAWLRVPQEKALKLFDAGLAAAKGWRPRTQGENPDDYAARYVEARRVLLEQAWAAAKRGYSAHCADFIAQAT